MLERFHFENEDDLRALLEFMLTCIKEAYARNQALTAAVEAMAHIVTGGNTEATRILMESIEEGVPEFQKRFDETFKARFAGYGLGLDNLRSTISDN